MTRDAAGPQIQGLLDLREVSQTRFALIFRKQTQTNLAEMKTVRILSQPVVEFYLAFFIGGITNLSAMSVVLS